MSESTRQVSRASSASEFYDAIAEEYEALFLDASSLDENQTVFDLIGKDIWQGDGILDLGCGPGTLLGYVDVPPPKYLGLDISPKMVALAQRRHPAHHFKAADITDADVLAETALRLDFTGYGFAVSTFGVLSYVEDLSAVLSNVARLLHRDGKLFFMVYKAGYSPYTHERFGQSVPHKTYTMQEIRDILEPDWKRGMVLDLGDFVGGVGLELDASRRDGWHSWLGL